MYMQKISQEDILTRLKSNDKAALKDLFQEFYPYVCSAIFKIVKERNTVEDLRMPVMQGQIGQFQHCLASQIDVDDVLV